MSRCFIAFLLLICAAITNRAQDNQEPLIDHFRAGQRAAAEHQIDRAITEFRAVLRLDPTVVQARANLGLMYYLAGCYKDAVSELSKVTQGAPDVLAGHLFLGMSYVKLAQPQKAIDPLKQAMRLDPSNREAARALLTCYLALDRYQQARQQLEFFARETTNEESPYLVGQAYLEMGRALTSRMAQQYRSSAWAHRLVGDLASDRSDWNAAIDAYQKALTIDPEMPGINSALAAAMRASGKSDRAKAPVHDKTDTSRTGLCANLTPQACAAHLRQKPNRTAEEELALGRAFEATNESERQRMSSPAPWLRVEALKRCMCSSELTQRSATHISAS